MLARIDFEGKNSIPFSVNVMRTKATIKKVPIHVPATKTTTDSAKPRSRAYFVRFTFRRGKSFVQKAKEGEIKNIFFRRHNSRENYRTENL